MNIEHNHHHMQFLGADPSGGEEWLCPTCGRRLRLRWSPAPEREVLEAGDESAVHSSQTEGLWLSAPDGLEAEVEGAAPPAEQLPWRAGSSAESAFSKPAGFNAFHDFSEPETTDGLGPWLRFLERIDRASGL